MHAFLSKLANRQTDRQTRAKRFTSSFVGGNKKMSSNFGYIGRSNPWGDLDQMWRVDRYGGHNHVRNIW